MKKRSAATQTLRAGCSKADPQTNKHTDRGDYSTLRSLARSVIRTNAHAYNEQDKPWSTKIHVQVYNILRNKV